MPTFTAPSNFEHYHRAYNDEGFESQYVLTFDPKWSVLSNWQMTPFMVNGQHYHSAHQWLEERKAAHFGDTQAQTLIMRCESRRKIKTLGECIRGYNSDEWADVVDGYVFEGTLAKFKQHQSAKQMLLSTSDSTIKVLAQGGADVEWSTGLRASSCRNGDYAQWTGLNKLGSILLAVREEIKAAEKLCK